MTITRQHNGSILISDIVHGHYVSRVYYGYTERQAVALFKEYIYDSIQ